MIPLIDQQYCIRRWMQLVRAHDIGLYRHSLLVADLAAAFTAHLGLSPTDQRQIVEAATLHDVGKIKISRELLTKPSPLTLDEMQEIRRHPEMGYQLLLSDGRHRRETLSVVRQHHERLDGSGYPDGLLATAISEPVRIVTLCDVYAAMTERRLYGTPFTREDALLRMAEKRTRLDLDLLKHFTEMTLNSVHVYPTTDALNTISYWRRDDDDDRRGR